MIGPVLPTAVQVIEAQREPLVLHLIVPGKQGPPGPPGPSGDSGSDAEATAIAMALIFG
jgi:hypothetical protein